MGLVTKKKPTFLNRKRKNQRIKKKCLEKLLSPFQSPFQQPPHFKNHVKIFLTSVSPRSLNLVRFLRVASKCRGVIWMATSSKDPFAMVHANVWIEKLVKWPSPPRASNLKLRLFYQMKFSIRQIAWIVHCSQLIKNHLPVWLRILMRSSLLKLRPESEYERASKRMN